VFRWVEHTGELELAIDAPTEPGVFRDALAAFAELVADGGEPESRSVHVRAAERDLLLVEWLGELAFLAETGFVAERADELEVSGNAVRATVVGRRGSPRPLVKAVTLHGLSFARDESGWHARVVLDV
jgi:SHS2 domain-containing protein